jgi:hypothetical protein
MYDYVVTEKTVGTYTVKVMIDDEYRDLADHFCDEPIGIVTYDCSRSQELYSGVKWPLPSWHVCRAIENHKSDELAAEIDLETRKAGKSWAWRESDCDKWQYCKSESALIRAMLRHAGFEGLECERFDTRDGGYFLCFKRDELDKFAGCKGAVSPLETVKAVFNGDIYGFLIEDKDGNQVESCWGFVGDPDYCLSDGVSSAEYLVTQDEKQAIIDTEIAALELGAALDREARAMEAARPDMYP